MRTPYPVPPADSSPSSSSPNAGPAMSRWAHGIPSPTNRRRNSAATIVPAGRPPTFFRSAIFDSRSRAIVAVQRQWPQGLAGSFGSGLNLRGERLVVAEHCRDFAAERDHGRARERGEVDDGGGMLFARGHQSVGQDQPAFGVGVEHLDRRPVAIADDVADPFRVATEHVVGEGEDARTRTFTSTSRATDMAAATAAAPPMSPFMPTMPSVDLIERPPESNVMPFPTERDRHPRRGLGFVGQLDPPWRVRRPTVHREQAGVTGLGDRVLRQHLDTEARPLGERTQLLRERRRRSAIRQAR